jgi:hypothetical protein
MESIARILLLLLGVAVALAFLNGGPKKEGGIAGLTYWINQKFALNLTKI